MAHPAVLLNSLMNSVLFLTVLRGHHAGVSQAANQGPPGWVWPIGREGLGRGGAGAGHGERGKKRNRFFLHPQGAGGFPPLLISGLPCCLLASQLLHHGVLWFECRHQNSYGNLIPIMRYKTLGHGTTKSEGSHEGLTHPCN
jgi:hypothetical protein